MNAFKRIVAEKRLENGSVTLASKRPAPTLKVVQTKSKSTIKDIVKELSVDIISVALAFFLLLAPMVIMLYGFDFVLEMIG